MMNCISGESAHWRANIFFVLGGGPKVQDCDIPDGNQHRHAALQSTIASMKVWAWRIASPRVVQTPADTVCPLLTVHFQPRGTSIWATENEMPRCITAWPPFTHEGLMREAADAFRSI
jgi:hypothetical protein